MKKLISAALVLCMLLSAFACASIWLPYGEHTLQATLCSTDPELVDFNQDAGDGTMAVVRLNSVSGPIPTETIIEIAGVAVLRDANGTEYPAYSYRLTGVGFDAASGQFSTNPTQESVDLLFFMEGRDESVIDGGKLVVPVGNGEKILIALDEVSREAA